MPFTFQIQSAPIEIDGQVEQVGVEDQCIENKTTNEMLSISKGRDKDEYDFMQVKRTKIRIFDKKKKT